METTLHLSLLSAQMVVERKNMPALFAALLEAAEQTEAVSSPFPQAETLQEHLERVWGWHAEIDSATGNMLSLTPLRDDVNVNVMEAMLNTFAPFVKVMQPPCHFTYRDQWSEIIYRYVLPGEEAARKQRALLQFVDIGEQTDGWEGATLHKLTDEECYMTAQMILAAHTEQNILSYLEDIYGKPAHAIEIALIEKKGGSEISVVYVYDQDGQQIHPNLQLPYWRRVLTENPNFFEGCDDHYDVLDAIYDHLYTEHVYLKYALPVEQTPGKWLLSKRQIAYPVLYQPEGVPALSEA